jgi:death-on-curing protein
VPRVFLTVAEVEAIHRLLIDEYGGIHGIRDKHLLESAVFRPQSGYYGDIIEEAAALMESLSNNHPFLDGNKRSSFVVTDTFLRANGYFIDADTFEAYTFINKALEEQEFKFSAIRTWITENVKGLE